MTIYDVTRSRIFFKNVVFTKSLLSGITNLKELINKQSYSMNNNITITSIAYYICPLINSMIRLGEHEQKYNMFKAMCNSTELIERKLRGKGVVPISISEYVYKDCLQLNKKQKEIVVESSEYIENEVQEYNLDNLIDDSTEDNIENNTFASIVSVDSLPDEIKNNNPRERGKSVLKTVLEQLGISYENT